MNDDIFALQTSHQAAYIQLQALQFHCRNKGHIQVNQPVKAILAHRSGKGQTLLTVDKRPEPRSKIRGCRTLRFYRLRRVGVGIFLEIIFIRGNVHLIFFIGKDDVGIRYTRGGDNGNVGFIFFVNVHGKERPVFLKMEGNFNILE